MQIPCVFHGPGHRHVGGGADVFLGAAERNARRLQHCVGELVDVRVELARWHHVADDAVGQRALGRHLEHRIHQIGHRFARHAVDKRRHHHRRHDLVRHFRHREARLVAGDSDVAGCRDRAAEAVRAAVHHRDDRDRAIAHRAIGVKHHVGEAAPRISGRLDRGACAHAGAADAEVLAGAAQHDDVGLFGACLMSLVSSRTMSSVTALPRFGWFSVMRRIGPSCFTLMSFLAMWSLPLTPD